MDEIRKKTNLESLLENVVSRHPGEARIIEISKEDMDRACKFYRDSTRKIALKLEALRHERAQAMGRAKDIIIG